GRPREDECRMQGFVDAGQARAADGRAAVGRRPRNHRQGLYQPACYAGASQGAGRQALCRWSRRDRNQLTEETMAGNGQTIIDLDRKRMQAMATKDVATLESLIADDLIYTHSSARLDTKRSLIDNMASGSTVYTAVEPSEVKAQDLGDTVVLTGVAQIKVTAN